MLKKRLKGWICRRCRVIKRQDEYSKKMAVQYDIRICKECEKQPGRNIKIQTNNDGKLTLETKNKERDFLIGKFLRTGIEKWENLINIKS